MTINSNGRRGAKRLLATIGMAAGITLAAAACTSGGGGGTGGDTPAAGTPVAGGDATILLDAAFSGNWPTGLDPAVSNSVGANLGINLAIFGGLFTIESDGKGGGTLTPNQAESYSWSDDQKTLTIKLKDGVKFSDGTPLNAEAVLWNWVRATHSGSTSAPRPGTLATGVPMPSNVTPEFLDSLYKALPADVDKKAVEDTLGAFQMVDDLTVTMQLAAPNAAWANGIPGAVWNFIASPTAYAATTPEEFKSKPVGAGPFTVVTDSLSEKLELTKNPDYFVDGLPYLDNLTFQSVQGGQVGYQALLGGQGSMLEGLSDVKLIQEAKGNDQVKVHPGVPTSPYVIQLNMRQAPFDNEKARQAIYYATDWDSINKGLFNGEGEPSQTFMASGDLFTNTKVDGYREFDLDKAKALVQEIGGLKIELGTTDVTTARNVITALQTQWKEAGIDVSIKPEPLGDVISRFVAGNWQALLQTAGAWDPSVGIGVQVRFGSLSPYSGAPQNPDKSPTELDKLLSSAVATTDMTKRADAYDAVAKYISDNAMAPFGFSFTNAQITVPGLHGPGIDVPAPALLVNQGVMYDRVWLEQ